MPTTIRMHRSLRFKLIFASIIVEIVMLTALVANSVRLIEDSLLDLTKLRVTEVERLLNSAMAAPMVQRDYATLQEIADQSLNHNGFVYFVITDFSGNTAITAGWPSGKALPPVESSIYSLDDNNPDRFDGQIPITMGGQEYGKLHYGVSTAFLSQAKSHLLNQSLVIAAGEIALSAAILAFLGIWLTRHLGALTHASDALAAGNIDITLPVKNNDEIGLLTRTFNAMAQSIRTRIKALSDSESKFHAIADYTYDWESWYDPANRLIWVNPSVERMTGYTPAECLAMQDFPMNIIVDEDRAYAKKAYTVGIRGSTGHTRFRVRRKDGTFFWASAGWQPIFGSTGEYMGIRSSIRDVTEQVDAESALQEKIRALKDAEAQQSRFLTLSRQEQARLSSLLAAMKRGILFESVDGKIAYYNPAFTQIWMIDPLIDLTGKSTDHVLKHSANVLARPDHFSKFILQTPETHEISETFEVVMSDGRIITQMCYPVRDPDGKFLGRLWVYEDVTRERQTAEQLIYLAERDSLTGLLNRRRFQDELARALDIGMRRKSHGALIFFDLDEFKYINDTYGHRAGDSMLIRVAGEVGALTRHTEVLSRLGGDEFAILMPDADQKEAEALAERIVRAVSQIPFRFEGRTLRLTTSVGIALYPIHGAEHEDLVARADAAMYQAKEAGKNAWRVYRDDLDGSREMVERLSWNNRIAHGIDRNLFRLHFQGIYNAKSGQLAHVETLVRLLDEERPDTLIMPARFINIAEKTGQILHIDRWVIRNSIQALAQRNPFPSVPISVNISGRSFDDPSLPQYISDQLKLFNVPPERLVVELTETSAVSDLHDAQRFIESLQQTGCRVSLDDFGSGFSSFTYLKHLKADILKIDGQFIRDLPNDHENQIFVRAIVDVARGLRKQTIAEFVEDAATLAMLREFGVEMVQGYHLHMPSADPPLMGMRDTRVTT